jgi:hypothetical protein
VDRPPAARTATAGADDLCGLVARRRRQRFWPAFGLQFPGVDNLW